MRTVLLANPFADELLKLPKREYRRVEQAINRLAEDPVSGSYFLRSTRYGSDLYAIRVGNYTIIYGVNSETNTVTITSIFKKITGHTDLPLAGGWGDGQKR
jgi:mRNA-degrading endonuclease RelE of RelBE toxin-antitoxin system